MPCPVPASGAARFLPVNAAAPLLGDVLEVTMDDVAGGGAELRHAGLRSDSPEPVMADLADGCGGATVQRLKR